MSAAVEPVAVGDVDLGRDDLLRAQDAHRHVQEPRRHRRPQPLVAHAQARHVAHGEEDVEQVRRAVHLGQPARVAELGVVAGLRERVQRRAHVLRPHEHVHVLAVAPDSREGVLGVGAAQRVRHVAAAHDLEPLVEEPGFFRREVQRPHHGAVAERHLEVSGVVVCRFGKAAHHSLHLPDTRPLAPPAPVTVDGSEPETTKAGGGQAAPGRPRHRLTTTSESARQGRSLTRRAVSSTRCVRVSGRLAEMIQSMYSR